MHEDHAALIHSFTIGEIALGRLADRESALFNLTRLSGIVVARHDEVMRMIEAHAIARIGYVAQAERLGILAPLA